MVIRDGYILTATGNDEQYKVIRDAVTERPEAPDGYGYRLRDNLTWEMYKLPDVTDGPEEATAEDYQTALEEMGCSFDD